MALMIALLFILSCLLPVSWSSIQNSGIQPLPPMGFNNWARFLCDLNQTLFTDTADAMIENGLLDAGYDYINLDDCWLEKSRAPNGSLVWNSTLFPDGLVWLGDYLHHRGFKYGIYQDAGNLTCGGYPGSKGYEEIDAATFKDWGFDYLKLDGCNIYNNSDPRPLVEQFRVLYKKWYEVLSAEKRPLVFSESAPAYFSPNFQTPPRVNNTDWYTIMENVPRFGELARHSDDVKIWGFNGILDPTGHWASIMSNYGMNTLLARYQTCGFYNDPDFLIPFPDLTEEEKRSHFSLWASFSAPLIISAYIPELPESDIEYLSNKDVIKVDQDPLCQQATLVSQDGYWDVLTKSLANGDRLLTILNRGENVNSTSVDLIRAGLLPETSYLVYDLWTGEKYSVSDSITFPNKSPHSTTVLRISASPEYGSGYGTDNALHVTPTGMIFNTFSGLCLTAPSHTSSPPRFQPCNALDTQVWQVAEHGLLAPLSALDSCLGAQEHEYDATLALRDCSGGYGAPTEWAYYLSGNLEIAGSGLCLSEGEDGEAQLEGCRAKIDGQVLALPVGVRIRGR